MVDEKVYKEIRRLNFEDFLWIIFAILCLLNVYGDYDEKQYLKSHDNKYKEESNKVFTLTLIVTFFIYVYFLLRNYKSYENIDENQKRIYLIKLLGSSFLIAGVLCLLYFQIRQNNFTGSPAL